MDPTDTLREYRSGLKQQFEGQSKVLEKLLMGTCSRCQRSLNKMLAQHLMIC